MKTGAQLIFEERNRQQSEEDWTPEHDDQHINGEMAKAAVCYAIPERNRLFAIRGEGFHIRVAPEWPWDVDWWKPTPNTALGNCRKQGL